MHGPTPSAAWSSRARPLESPPALWERPASNTWRKSWKLPTGLQCPRRPSPRRSVEMEDCSMEFPVEIWMEHRGSSEPLSFNFMDLDPFVKDVPHEQFARLRREQP